MQVTLSQIGPAALNHQVLTLNDGHRVGVTVGGHGVPLVFLHGIAMNRRSYEVVLEQLAQIGFFVVAIDAPGHGETENLPQGNATWARRVALVDRVLDELGINRAVLVGHSMGGRKAVALAATRPARAAAAVLVSAATGSVFEQYMGQASRSRAFLTRGMVLALYDTVIEQFELRGPGLRWVWSLARSMARSTRSKRSWLADVGASIMQDADGRDHLEAIGNAGLPVFVLHGKRDLVIRYGTAVATSELARGLLIELPRARHSWLIGSPGSFAGVMADLLDHELGLAVGVDAGVRGLHGEPAGWLDPDGIAYRIAGTPVRTRRTHPRPARPPLEFVRRPRTGRVV